MPAATNPSPTDTPQMVQARDAAHAIQHGEPAPQAWLTSEQLNATYGTNVQVKGAGEQSVKILDPHVAAQLEAGQDEEHVR